MVRYRSSRLPGWMRFGRKVMTDYGTPSYEDRLDRDDYGNSFDPRKQGGDVSYEETGERRV
jgi:hypothetical protein